MALVAALLVATPSQAEEPPVPSMEGEAAFVPPDLAGGSGEPGPLAEPWPHGSQTSEYLAGSVVYSVVLVESSGGVGNCSPADSQSENWSAATASQVLDEIDEGINFWETRSNGPTRNFILDNLGVRATSCEPIARPAYDQQYWIADVLVGMGYDATPSNYFTTARTLAGDRRDAKGADWAFTIFVVDSLNDSDGCFAPGCKDGGMFAYAYLNGPFMVMTFDNSTWGIDRMDKVTRHEMGHTFGALDEYASSNCSTSASWGYLNALNTSCNNEGITDDISIMGETGHPDADVSASARDAIGWRNPAVGHSGKLVTDVVRSTAATPYEYMPDPTVDTTPTYIALASNPPFPPEGPRFFHGYYRGTADAVSISRTVWAEWNVDGGDFMPVQPDDGAFDEQYETYHFTPATPLAYGTYTFGTRSGNDFGDTSSISTDTLTIGQDSDGDGFADAAEAYMGTDPLDNCSADAIADNEPLDALPPDMNDDRSVNILDQFKMFPYWLQPAGTEGARFDLNTDGFVNVLDVFQMFPYWLESCT